MIWRTNARFEAQVIIGALGGSACEAESEDFLLCFGETATSAKSSTGKVRPTLALALAHLAADDETFKQLALDPGNRSVFSTDKNGFITCRLDGKVGRVFCPPLIAQLGRDWVNREGALGRWRLTVRSDGTPIGEAEFVPVASEFGAGRLAQQSRQLANWMAGSQGPLGILYHHEIPALNQYVLAASDAWQQGAPELTLINTLEVVSLAGRTLGLVVLPIHPLRVAWQQSFDLLVAHHRYRGGPAGGEAGAPSGTYHRRPLPVIPTRDSARRGLRVRRYPRISCGGPGANRRPGAQGDGRAARPAAGRRREYRAIGRQGCRGGPGRRDAPLSATASPVSADPSPRPARRGCDAGRARPGSCLEVSDRGRGRTGGRRQPPLL